MFHCRFLLLSSLQVLVDSLQKVDVESREWWELEVMGTGGNWSGPTDHSLESTHALWRKINKLNATMILIIARLNRTMFSDMENVN